MPQYFSIPNFPEIGKISIIPEPFSRRIKLLGFLLPYHVGNRIKFTICVEKPLELSHHGYHIAVFERFNNEITFISNLITKETVILGDRIISEGDIEYFISFSTHGVNRPVDYYKEPVLTARVLNWDTVFVQWGWLLIGTVLSILAGFILWLLGFIQINPAFIATFN